MIRVEGLCKYFEEDPALQDVSLDIPDGELFVLIGPDGAGKTTFFRILVTLMLPDAGTVQVAGLDAVSKYREVRKIAGYMPGTFSLYPDLTVRENLQFYARIFGTTIREHYSLIRDVYEQIEPFRDRPAGKLSGGMKQKLALSCALIHRPRLLVLDEPTTGVDAASRREFWGLLRNIRAEGITILVSTPYMSEAGLGDRSGFLHEGHLLMADKPDNLVAKFPGPLYACSSENNFILLKALRSHPGIVSATLFGGEIHFRSAGNTPVPRIITDLEKTTGSGIDFKAIKPTLEDTFTWLTRTYSRENQQNSPRT